MPLIDKFSSKKKTDGVIGVEEDLAVLNFPHFMLV